MLFSKTPIIALIKLSGIISPEGRLGSKSNLNLNDLSDSLTKAFNFKNADHQFELELLLGNYWFRKSNYPSYAK